MNGYTREGKRFKLLREELDYTLDANKACTQEMLASELHISGAQISDLENNKKYPSLNELVVYADYFNTPIEYLLGKSENRHHENVKYGRELGLSDNIVNELRKYASTGASLVSVLNEIYRIGYGRKFLEALYYYFIGNYGSGKSKDENVFVGEVYEDKTWIGAVEPASKINRVFQLELYDMLKEMKDIFDKDGFYNFMEDPKLDN